MVNNETLEAEKLEALKEKRRISAMLGTDKLKNTLNDRAARGDEVKVAGNSNIKRNIWLIVGALLVFNYVGDNEKTIVVNPNTPSISSPTVFEQLAPDWLNEITDDWSESVTYNVLRAFPDDHARAHAELDFKIGKLKLERDKAMVDSMAQLNKMFPTDHRYSTMYNLPDSDGRRNETEQMLADIEYQWRTEYQRHRTYSFKANKEKIEITLGGDIYQLYGDKIQALRFAQKSEQAASLDAVFPERDTTTVLPQSRRVLDLAIYLLELKRYDAVVDAIVQLDEMFPTKHRHAVKYNLPNSAQGGNKIEQMLVDIEHKWRARYEETSSNIKRLAKGNGGASFKTHKLTLQRTLSSDIERLYDDRIEELRSVVLNMKIDILVQERDEDAVDAMAILNEVFLSESRSRFIDRYSGYGTPGTPGWKLRHEIKPILFDIENQWFTRYKGGSSKIKHTNYAEISLMKDNEEMFKRRLINNINQFYDDKIEELRSAARVTLDNDDTNGSSMNG